MRVGAGPAAAVRFTGFFLLAAAWAVTLPVNGAYDEKQHVVRAYAVATGQVPPHLVRMVGEFGYGEIGAPRGVVPGWYLLVAVVVLPALATAGWRGRAAVLVAVLAGLTLLVALDAWSIRSNGWFSQGRYALPVTAGVVPLAAAVGRRGPRCWRWYSPPPPCRRRW